MNVVTWPDGVNDRFFAFSDKPKKTQLRQSLCRAELSAKK